MWQKMLQIGSGSGGEEISSVVSVINDATWNNVSSASVSHTFEYDGIINVTGYNAAPTNTAVDGTAVTAVASPNDANSLYWFVKKGQTATCNANYPGVMYIYLE